MNISLSLYATDLLSKRRSLAERYVDSPFHFKEGNQDNIFQQLSRAGINDIELILPSKLSDNEEKMLLELVEKNNVSIASIHQNLMAYKNSIQKLEKLCKLSHIFGAKTIVVHIYTVNSMLGKKKNTEKLAQLEKKYGVVIGIENSPKSLFAQLKKYYWNTKQFSDFVKKHDLHVTFDTTHVGHSKGDVLEFYRYNKNRIVNIHLSDFGRGKQHIGIGKGHLPIKKLLQILKNDKYKGLVTLELELPLNETLESIKKVKQYLS